MRGAIFGNVGTLVSFQLGPEDADYIARKFPPVSLQELTELANHHIYLKLKVKSITSSPFSARILPPPPGRDLIVQRSRRFYAWPRALVDDAPMRLDNLLLVSTISCK